jgi:hypothetical protein
MVFAILRTALGWWAADDAAAALEFSWIWDQFDRVHGEELYDRYLRVCDAINNTNDAG